MQLNRFHYLQRVTFRNLFQHTIALVGASFVYTLIQYSLAACRAHIYLESFINTIKLHVGRQKGSY